MTTNYQIIRSGRTLMQLRAASPEAARLAAINEYGCKEFPGEPITAVAGRGARPTNRRCGCSECGRGNESGCLVDS